MAWDPPWDTAIHGSHAPGVGAGEHRASAAAGRVEGAPAAAAAHGYGPDLLGRAIEALEELAEFAADGAARDRGRLAPAGVQALVLHQNLGRLVQATRGPSTDPRLRASWRRASDQFCVVAAGLLFAC